MKTIFTTRDLPAEERPHVKLLKNQVELVDILSDELILLIFSHLAIQNLGSCELVSRNWNRLAKDKSLLRCQLKNLEAQGRFRFIGKDTWNHYIGDVGEVPPLPKNIIQILFSPCPWENPEAEEDGPKVKDTHVFGLIPEKINGKPLTPNSIEELVKTPKGEGYPTKYRHICDKIKNGCSFVIKKSYWALMTRGVIDRSVDEKALAKRRINYGVATLLEAVSFNFLLYVRGKERLFSDNSSTYTYCQEVSSDGWKLIVGGFSPMGLYVGYYYGIERVGVVMLRRF